MRLPLKKKDGNLLNNIHTKEDQKEKIKKKDLGRLQYQVLSQEIDGFGLEI